MTKNFVPLFVILFIGLFVLYEAAFIVMPFEQVLVLEFGNPQRVIQKPGLHWKTPFIESLVIYDKRILSLDSPPEEIICADKLRVVVDAYTRFRIVDPLKFYQKAGTEERALQLLQAQISPDLRKVLGQATFGDLLSEKRTELMNIVKREASHSSRDLGIQIIDIRIRRADLPKQNSEAVFQRMNSERERIAKEIRATGREKAQKIRAGADKESAVIVAEAAKNAQLSRSAGDQAAAQMYQKAYQKDKSFYKYYRALKAYEASFEGDQTTFILDPSAGKFFKAFKNGS